jgi:hypothetical protein
MMPGGEVPVGACGADHSIRERFILRRQHGPIDWRADSSFRRSETLFLGELASSILEHNEVSVLFLASESYGHTGASAAAAQLAP